MKLDIGCGLKWPEGWEGLDRFDANQKYLCDAEKLWPEKLPLGDYSIDDGGVRLIGQKCVQEIKSHSVEAIRIYNALEHFSRQAAWHLLNECSRILGKNGTLEILVPDGAYPDYAWKDPTHLSCWTLGTFTEYICGGRPRNAKYDLLKWDLVKAERTEANRNNLFIIMKPRK